MRRPVGVVVAAVVLGIFTLMGMFGAVVTLGVALFLKNPIIQQAPAVHAAIIGIDCAILAFFAFCGAAVIGLLRMRSWARISIVVIGGVLFVLCALSAVGIFLARGFAPPMPPQAAAVNIQAVMVGVAAFYFLLSLVGVWWLVYFNLASARAAFVAARMPSLPPPSAGSPLPAGRPGPSAAAPPAAGPRG